MDPFKLLSRSTKISRASKEGRNGSTPSRGRAVQPQLFASKDGLRRNGLGKRKRDQDDRIVKYNNEAALEFFDDTDHGDSGNGLQQQVPVEETHDSATNLNVVEAEGHAPTQPKLPLPLEERKRVFKQHKLKATWLNPRVLEKGRKGTTTGRKPSQKGGDVLFPSPLESLQDLCPCYGLSKRLSSNIADQGYAIPTEVQIGALPLLLEDPRQYIPGADRISTNTPDMCSHVNLLTVAPTGSGKTLAFMIPLLHSLLSQRQLPAPEGRYTSAIILAPTKELASQITNEGRKLVIGTGLSITQMRRGMKLPSSVVHSGVDDEGEDVRDNVVKADLIVSTPGILRGIIGDSRYPAWQIQHLILDEADVLLDPLFREQTLDIWNSLTEPNLRVSLWSATMGSNIEELARSTIQDRLERLSRADGVEIAEAPLIRLVVGLKDSAVPNVKHQLTYAATERGKLMGLRQLLHPVSSANDSAPVLRPPLLVFTQTIERAIALYSELLYDIPAEAGGIGRIAVLHSDLSDAKRDGVMTRFRKGDIWVLITTDLLSRGVDFRGVNGVVNYDIPTSSAAYVHRIGRTGRAGRDGGVAVTLYGKEDIPYLKHVVNVIAMAEKQNGSDSGVQQWLLDALPRLSKNEKQNLKKRGLEFKTGRGQKKDSKAARRSKISTKSGFVRRSENNRRGAILGSRRRSETHVQPDAGEDTDFTGFE